MGLWLEGPCHSGVLIYIYILISSVDEAPKEGAILEASIAKLQNNARENICRPMHAPNGDTASIAR